MKTTHSMNSTALALLWALGILLIVGVTGAWAQDPEAARNAAKIQEMRELSLMDYLKSAGWVAIPLILASIITVIVAVMNFLYLRKSNVVTESYLNAAQTYISSGDLMKLHDLSQKTKGAVPAIIYRAMEFARNNPGSDFTSVKEIASTEGNRQAAKMNQLAYYLLDIGAVAPMIGLVGTVIGILRAFGAIATETSPMRTMFLASGGVPSAGCHSHGAFLSGWRDWFFLPGSGAA
ncbi:MotA/TolQ/ExbB proton channel family protein [Kamptonema cortianum]|nr:MotA/TolQ/ExbB proton channel family protein [Kamptonema cortianum]